MRNHLPGRRDFLKTMTVLGAAGLPAVVPGLGLRRLYAAGDTGRSNSATAYDPTGRFEIKVSEVEFRRTRAGS